MGAPDTDILDRRGRMTRFAIALLIGAAAAALAGWAAYELAKPDQIPKEGVYTMQLSGRAWGFVAFFAGLGGAVAFALSGLLLRRRARASA